MPGGAGQYRAAGQGQQPQSNPNIQRFANLPAPGRFDGPSEGPGSPRPMSGHNTPRPGSPNKQQGQGARGPNPFQQGPGYDPAKSKESVITNRRVELPSAAYQLDRSVSKHVSLDVLAAMMVDPFAQSY